MYAFLRREMQAGRQIYVVYPLVEESEATDVRAATEMAARLRREVFPDFRVGLLHGRMSVAEKDRVMAEFRTEAIQLLVSTTVVEVGIDVPNATMMVVEHAERFGLSQLHQLRGRVGRGPCKSYCALMTQGASDDARRRLDAMVATNDGFRIAEADLELRARATSSAASQGCRVQVADLFRRGHAGRGRGLRAGPPTQSSADTGLRRALPAGAWLDLASVG